MDALYIMGEPGIGKSTLAEYLTEGLPVAKHTKYPFPHRVFECGVMEFGEHHGAFPGTDTLGLNIQPAVEQYLRNDHPPYIFAEGDRLANEQFFYFLLDVGYSLTVAYLWGPPDVAIVRRINRGSRQNEAWQKSRRSKLEDLADKFDDNVVDLDARLPPDGLADLLYGDPVAHRLTEAKKEAVSVLGNTTQVQDQ